MEQVTYDINAEPGDKDEKDDEDGNDICRDYKSDSHYDIYNKKDPEKTGWQTQPLLYIQDIYGIMM